MKTITLVIIALCVTILQLQAQTVNSSCSASDSIIKLYRNDADWLTFSRTNQTNNTYKDSVKLNPTLRSNYLHALLAVYNATALPGRDTVVGLKIHTFPYYVLNELLFQISGPSYTWAQNLQNNIFPTGYSSLDNVMSEYHLNLSQYYSYSQYGMLDDVLLKCDSNFNVLRMVNIFTLSVQQAYNPEPNGVYGDGRTITDSITSNYTQLTYIYKWGDCPSGCFNSRSWRFRVYNNCSVEYLGSYGDPIPAVYLTLGLKDNGGFDLSAEVFPNPVTDRLTLQLNTEMSAKVTVNDVLGKIVKEVSFTGNHAEIDFAGIPKGIYFTCIESANEKKMIKVIKE